MTKIHGSVRTLGTRLEDIEKNKSRRYKHLKRRMSEKNAECENLRAQYRQIETELEEARQQLRNVCLGGQKRGQVEMEAYVDARHQGVSNISSNSELVVHGAQSSIGQPNVF